MNKRHIGNTRTHKIIKVGNKSYTITMPVEFIRHLKWQEGQKVDITLKDNTIVIQDWKK
jgi:antitoxin component of MazEF toxin-antitoxin module